MFRTSFTLAASALALAFAVPAAAQQAPAPFQTGRWGIDTSQIDPAIKPGDDFNAYVNGKYVREHPIPPEFSRYSTFEMLNEQSVANVHQLIADLAAANPAPGTQQRRIVDAYNAFLDTQAIDAAGLAPAQPYLQKIAAARSLAELAPLFATPGYTGLVSADVSVDAKDPDHYIVSVGFAGMGLPDRDYYLVDSERNRTIQGEYKKFLAFLLGKAGYAEPAAMAEQVYAFEHKVAELEWARQALRNKDLTYHKLTRAQLLQLAGDFPLAPLLDAGGFGTAAAFDVPQIPPSAEDAARLELKPADVAQIGGGLPAMMKLLQATPLEVLKAHMVTRFLSSNAAVLPSDIDAANFAFYGTLLSGQQQQRPRWKRAIAATEGELGEQVGALYAARYFPPASKAAMLDLVGNLRTAFAQAIAQNTWLSPATRKQALIKLTAFNQKIGYPDKPKTYDGLVIDPRNPLANRIAAIAWDQAYDLGRLNGPVDRTEWGMLADTVNAYYNAEFNEVVFPAAILQPPFFTAGADPAVNYGAIGAVIGHEMSHGFDDQGAKSDATGALRDWWTAEDFKRFNALGDRLAAQYAAFCPFDDGKTCLNGRLTLGENIADNNGLSIAYRAYHLSLKGKPAPVIDGLTGDQRFYLAFAQAYRSVQREASRRQRILTDPHSPEEVRVNYTVRNQDPWYRAFNVKPGDKLYLPPEQRVHFW